MLLLTCEGCTATDARGERSVGAALPAIDVDLEVGPLENTTVACGDGCRGRPAKRASVTLAVRTGTPVGPAREQAATVELTARCCDCPDGGAPPACPFRSARRSRRGVPSGSPVTPTAAPRAACSGASRGSVDRKRSGRRLTTQGDEPP